MQFFHNEDSNLNDLKIDGRRNDGKKTYFIGTWELINKDKILAMNYSNVISGNMIPSGTGPFITGAKPEWEILRLTDKEVKMKTNYNGKEYLIKLETI